MKPSSLLARLLLGAGLVLASASLASAQDAGVPLEFRGMLSLGDGVMVGLCDRSTNESFWVSTSPTAGKSPAGVTVRAYDPKAERLTLDYHGRTYTLMLAQSVITIAPPVQPDPPPDETPPADGTVTTEPSGQIAGEVQRRRSLRQVEVITQTIQQQTGVNIFAPTLPPADAAESDVTSPP